MSRGIRMAERWWISLPRAAARVSRGLAFSLADGHFLAAVFTTFLNALQPSAEAPPEPTEVREAWIDPALLTELED